MCLPAAKTATRFATGGAAAAAADEAIPMETAAADLAAAKLPEDMQVHANSLFEPFDT